MGHTTRPAFTASSASRSYWVAVNCCQGRRQNIPLWRTVPGVGPLTAATLVAFLPGVFQPCLWVCQHLSGSDTYLSLLLMGAVRPPSGGAPSMCCSQIVPMRVPPILCYHAPCCFGALAWGLCRVMAQTIRLCAFTSILLRSANSTEAQACERSPVGDSQLGPWR